MLNSNRPGISSVATFIQSQHLLIVFPQVLNIPRVFQPPPIPSFQIIGSLPLAVDNPIRSFPIWPQLPVGRVSCCQGNPFQDEIPNIEAPGFHHGIILSCHKIFVPCCSLFCVHPNLVHKVQVKTELYFIFFSLIFLHPVAGHVYFCRYNGLTSIGQFKMSFPRGSSYCCSVSLQNTRC